MMIKESQSTEKDASHRFCVISRFVDIEVVNVVFSVNLIH
jgi:hypothetical protein